MLEVKDIHTYYGDSYILQGISLEVEKGSVIAILGRNGMGKTTLIHSIIGFNPPRQGRIMFQGKDITKVPSYNRVALGLGLVPQERRIFPSLTVLENLKVAANKEREDWTIERVFSVFPRLQERIRHRGDNLSGGEQQMLTIGRALMTCPSLLLMDEPSEGLAPVLVRVMRDSIFRLKEEGLSILLVEQNLRFALKSAGYVHLLERGKIAYSCTPEELDGDQETKLKYLGV
ncbi:MAG: ABC transporter ATP-binding protein [Deltaproteobacteria bacterium]|nr:ABC transporter ATP-binding protein [Deltaproteobacteria bacterium]MBW1943594.1 ABC transporter ATP-binding protein [Deltaproteobacteria bacterium]MBW2207132.1 ABC transporter ATP-binding protein [Deltaproteobacteria bacterium]